MTPEIKEALSICEDICIGQTIRHEEYAAILKVRTDLEKLYQGVEVVGTAFQNALKELEAIGAIEIGEKT